MPCSTIGCIMIKVTRGHAGKSRCDNFTNLTFSFVATRNKTGHVQLIVSDLQTRASSSRMVLLFSACSKFSTSQIVANSSQTFSAKRQQTWEIKYDIYYAIKMIMLCDCNIIFIVLYKKTTGKQLCKSLEFLADQRAFHFCSTYSSICNSQEDYSSAVVSAVIEANSTGRYDAGVDRLRIEHTGYVYIEIHKNGSRVE